MRMAKWMLLAGGLALGRLAAADASYQETTQISGGQLIDTVKSLPFIQKQISALMQPMSSLLMLHGNQLASVSRSSTQIIDLDRETLTHIDNDKKTYTITTFAQIRQAIKEAPQKIAQAQAKGKQTQPTTPDSVQPQVKVTFEVSVADTGSSKVINGLMAKEQVLTIKAHVSDPNASSSDAGTVTYSDITDIWTAPEPPEMKEIDAFYVRYAAKMLQGVDTAALIKSLKPEIGATSVAPLFASQPGMGAAVVEMGKKMATELQKIKGVRVLEITRFGGDAMVAASGTIPPPPPPQDPGATVVGKAAGDAATQTASDAAGAQVSKLGAFGSAFGHSVLGAFHHNTDPAPSTSTSASATQPTAASTAVLYETTAQKSNFSHDPVPPTAFDIPAGYTQLQSTMDAGPAK